MNNFSVSIKQDGVWQKLKANPVFPFSWGELLDERLDEAYLTVYDSRVENYPRLTEFKISIINGRIMRVEHFILASDNSYELPVGSGKYKHEIYLIERTKLLEGVLCSSLTFTNTKGNTYTDAQYLPIARDVGGGSPYSTLYRDDGGYFASPISFPSLKSPIDSTTKYSVPSAYDIAVVFAEYLSKQTGVQHLPVESGYISGAGTNKYYVNTELTVNNSSYQWKDSPSLLFSGSFELTYSTILQYNYTYYIAFKFTLELAAVQNRRPLKPWTITDCFNRCLELAEPLFKGQKPKYRLQGVEYDDDGNVKKPYPVGSLAEKYDKIFAPEFTLTEDTLREQLKVIFSFVHAEPWLDENDVIQVTEYGGTEKSAASSLPYVYNAASSHINEYCTEVRSHAQNLASSLGYAKGVMIDPGKGLYRSLRTDIAYSRIEESNGIARTEKPIYEIQQVMCGIASYRDLENGYILAPVDITPYVFEATEYGANLSSYKGGYPYSKAYAIYYTLGQPNLGGLFYKAPDAVNSANFSPFAISNILSAVSGVDVDTIDNELVKGTVARLVFSITYKPISNHFVSHGKSLYVAGEVPYMQLYNQSENLIESQYYGENLKGVAARLGNVEKERTFILKYIDNVPKVGQLLDGYAISTVSCELYPFDIKCTVGLSKDFNRISQYVGIDSQKRMYEVSERQTYQRELLLKNTLVIGTLPEGDSTGGKIFNNLTAIADVFDGNSGGYNRKISVVEFRGYNRSGKAVTGQRVLFPVISRALGNTVNFTLSPKDNYSAGNGTQYIDGEEDGITGRWETDTPYTDYYGRIYYATLQFLGGNIGDKLSDEEIVELAFDYPGGSSEGTVQFAITDHRLRKDNREIPTYNVELEIKTTEPDIIIGSALASLCSWVNDAEQAAPVLYVFDKSLVSIGKFSQHFSQEDANNSENLGPVSDKEWSLTQNTPSQFSITVPAQDKSDYGWVICTPIKTTTEQVENEDGEVETVTVYSGGEIILASTDASISNDSEGKTRKLDFYIAK